MNDDLRIYTLAEVKEILKVTQRSLYNYIRSEKLKATKVGRGWRVRHEDLQRFIDGKPPRY